MSRLSFLHAGLDPLGAGAVFVSVTALVAMFVALRAPAPAPLGNAYVTSAVAERHPVDRHDEATLQRLDAPSMPSDLHHPVDRHEEATLQRASWVETCPPRCVVSTAASST